MTDNPQPTPEPISTHITIPPEEVTKTKCTTEPPEPPEPTPSAKMENAVRRLEHIIRALNVWRVDPDTAMADIDARCLPIQRNLENLARLGRLRIKYLKSLELAPDMDGATRVLATIPPETPPSFHCDN